MSAIFLVLGAGAQADPSAAGIQVRETSLVVVAADGRRLTGPDLTGATMAVSDGWHGKTLIRFDGAERDATGLGWLYNIRVQNDADGHWTDFCKPDSVNERLAFAVEGHIDAHGTYLRDPEEFFLTCTSGAVAKCLRLGYLPWKTHPSGVTLESYFTACTRMIRADYCGDGSGHTSNGTPINVFDRLGIQTKDDDVDMHFEAAWGPEGALCVAKTRRSDHLKIERLAEICGGKFAGSLGQDCRLERAGKRSRALIFNDSLP